MKFEPENDRIEYKSALDDNKGDNKFKFEREAVAFLNANGGQIFIGVNKAREIVGVKDVDQSQLKIKDRIKNNILPKTLGLFDIKTEKANEKTIIVITISAGSETPYYIREYGRSKKGCYIRIGISSEPMEENMINNMMNRRVNTSITNIPSKHSDLTFRQLKIYYNERKQTLNDETFMENLELLTADKKPNFLAYMLADENNVSIRLAKYARTNKVDLIENVDFGNCSLVSALYKVLDKMDVENKVQTRLHYRGRENKRLVAELPLKEAIINAFVHNDYSQGETPIFEIFSDRFTITSYGGLPEGLTPERFFKGYTKTRNRELMKIFHDLDLVEEIGSGMGRILAVYTPDNFELDGYFMRVTFRFENIASDDVISDVINKENLVFEVIRANLKITKPQIAKETGIPLGSLDRIIKALKEQGRLKGKTANKGGTWELSG
ncbi:MAG: putative DNA binding domain-containing protein [Nitrososphaerota archaeon]|jgi:predicted HTH transcriptional regulator|nr:putative DNA binding domain-containing protein [Nitrososphaerota archaeon]